MAVDRSEGRGAGDFANWIAWTSAAHAAQ